MDRANWFMVAFGAALVVLLLGGERDAEELQPRPTEHVLDDGAEAAHKAGRKRWMREMHRVAPGVDWKALERQNGLREMERRRVLATQLPVTVGSSWAEVGSKNLAGRTRSSFIGPGDDELYVGSALGGLWRGTLDGAGWEPLGDNLYGGVSEVVVLDGGDAAHDIFITRDGDDLYRSVDDGATWGPVGGLPSSLDVRDLVLLGDAAQTVLVYGTAGGQSRVYDSIDGGLSFQLRWALAPEWDGGLWVPRAGPGAGADVYMLHQRKIYRSTSGGAGFSVVGTVAGSGSEGRITGSEAGAPTLYVSLRQSGSWNVFRSTNAGVSFTQRATNIGDYWDTSFCASITDPDLLLYGGVECWRSTNGGSSFSRVNSWGSYYSNPQSRLHADIFGIDCYPDPDAPATGERWIISCDGGTYESRTKMSTVNNLSMSGLGISQYYSTLSSAAEPTRLLAGSQDQGYQRGHVVSQSGSGPSTDMVQLISGDYGHLCSGDGTHSWVFSTYPGFVLVQQGESGNTIYQVSFPSGSQHLWLPPVVADPTDNQAFYFLGDRLWRYTRSAGQSWSHVQHSAQAFDSGSSDYLTAMAIAPSESSRMYACDEAGRAWVSTDFGSTWTQTSSSLPGEHYFYGNAICVHPTISQEVFIGGSGYSTAGVRRSTDGGMTWQPEVDGLPGTLVYDLAYAGDGSGDVYAATEAGAFRWERATETWSNIMGLEAPITLYWSVEAVPDSPLMRFGTYGRGIWDYTIGNPGPSGPGVAYCFGDGVSACPCGNVNDGSLNLGQAGCANGVSLGGAVLTASGTSSVSAQDLRLEAFGLDPNQPGLYFQGDNQIAGGLGVAFGDGLRCAGGEVVRLEVVVADSFGDSSTAAPVATRGGASAGDVKRYQLWYRNPGTSACLSGFNLTNGFEVAWQG